MKSALAASLALALSLALGACSGDDAKPAPDADRSSSAAPSPAAATAGVISPAGLAVAPEFSNDAQGVIDDVGVESCDTEPGKVQASGTATNSGKFPRDVVVTMSWTVGSVGDVVARGIAAVEDLAPGESGDWTIKTTLPGTTTAACVPSALAGQLKG